MDTPSTDAGSPSFEDLKRTASELLPMIEEDADEAERLTHQTDRVAGALRQTGLYSLLIPKELGGLELSFVEAMELVEIVTRAYASAGWCLMVQGVMGASAGAFMPEEGAAVVYPDGAVASEVGVTMSGQGVPRGHAREVEGGYEIGGQWGYGSGIYHADWVHTGCFVMDGDAMRMDSRGHPVVVIAHHPKDTIELAGNWDAHGLRGTGSYDYTVKGETPFVPGGRCYLFDNPAQMRGGIQYRSGLVGTTTWGHTSWALGVGRRVLDELAAEARRRIDVFGPMHESPSFRQSFADAEAKYRSARAFVYAAWEDLSEAFARGAPGTVEQFALVRLAMRHIHDVISDVSTFAHRSARGVALRPSVLQRCYRDIHAGTQHILLADQIVQECAKVLLGTAGEGAEWNVLGLSA